MTRPASRFLKTALAAVAGIAACGPIRAASTDPIGTWLTEDGRARVRTERCGLRDAQLCGYVVWVRKPDDDKGRPRADGENPDPGKQKRMVLGHQMILGLTLGEDRHYVGKIYNADNGKSYDVAVWSEETDRLSVQGCLLSMLCQTQTWKRVTDAAPGQLVGPTDGPGGPRADKEWAHKAQPTTGSNAAQRSSAPAGPPSTR